MGSFDYTCSVSKMPIGCGEEVKYLLLVKNPYEGENKSWVPKTYAVDAKYNDYGGFEFTENESFNLIHELLKDELVEVGIGDNYYHDPAVNSNQSLQEILSAVYTGRVFVKYDNSSSTPIKYLIPKGIPTIKRIQSLLKKNSEKLKSFNEKVKPQHFLVDKVKFGIIRIRFESVENGAYSKDLEALNFIKPLFSKYETIITAGYNVNLQAQMWVMVKPNTEKFYGSSRKKIKHLQIQQCVIRKDVWNELLTIPLETWKENYTIDSFKALTYKVFTDIKTELEGPTSKYLQKVLWNYCYDFDANNFASHFLTRNALPYVKDIASYFKLLIQKSSSLQDAKPTLDMMAETFYIQNILGQVRTMFEPANSFGSQFSEWDKPVIYYKKLLQISESKLEEQLKKYSKY